MPAACRLWPQITPWNVWDMPYCTWRNFAAALDAYIEAANKDGGDDR